MKPKPFKKSLLALIVGAISTQVLAVEVDIGQGKNLWIGETLNESLIFTGVLVPTANQNTGPVEADLQKVNISDTRIQGSLINRADIIVSPEDRSIRGFAVDPFGTTVGHLAASTITGDVIQAGNITMNNASGYEAFEVGAATIGGSIINSGTIKSTPGPADGDAESGDGIFLHNAQVAGDVSNTGVVAVEGRNVVGLAIDGPINFPISIGGKILNSGSITATGERAWAFEVETTTSPLRIENSGLLSANGAGASSVVFYEGTVDYILNTGTLEAKGSDANAFDFHGATFAQNSPTGSRGIVNRGLVSADGIAIKVHADEQTSPFEINQQAGEIRSNSGTAIDAANLASLNWSGGKIVGDVLGVTGVNITGQADFTGKSIASPVSINAGSLNLSDAGTAITGDLNVASGAGVDMRLSNSVVPTTPYLTVNGAANFAQGSNVTLSAKPGDFTAVPSGIEYTLLQASSVQNNGLTVASSSSLLDVFSYSADAQTVKAVVGLKSDEQVQEDLGGVGAGAASVTALNELKNEVLGQLSEDDAVFQAVANAGTAQQLAQIGEQLKPDVNRGALDVALSGQTVINGAILNRLAGQRDGSERGGVWVQGLSSNMDQDGRGGDNGYSANSSGMAVGVDGRLNDTTTVGAAYSYLNSNIHSDLGNKTEVQGNALSLYGNWSLQNWFVDGSLSYGFNDNDSKRHVAGTTAKGSYDSRALSASVLGGYSFKPSDSVLIEPRVAARYSSVRMDGFNEKGSSAALSTGSQRYEVGELGAGVRLAGNLPLGAGTLQPEATLMAYHDLMGDRVAQTSSFVNGGSTFSVTGASVARDSYEASVGVNYQVSAFSVGASYTRQARSGFDADGVMIKARYAF
ncbi:autotransporter [Pseudomonas brenneri]|uniref:Autotransporter domain-containing protein n=1 Tax=Pseudomonas brenneri TaxID=129817 RepID=A0A5B2UQ84_9PSED|nr:autotransporter outer membrane beta-barrel domain-containing protein [Pseudomonas brenneri]KAA2228994.1 autotransporter domain-containing protein [Pseudomonas brenneri]TWR76398.1 autotransporter domain-containing protein [Pseudomonas brenneri]GGL53508.1 autotransporter [Pseudomonas brenneri]SDV09839.1 outer membrane autotransporter barrel domain-containing protein [Pseudomonas brenneri]